MGLPILSTAGDMLMPAAHRALSGAWGDPTNSSVVWTYHPAPKKLGMYWGNYHSPERTGPRFALVEKWGYAADAIAFDGPRVFGAGREQDPKRASLAVFGRPSGESEIWFADPKDSVRRLRGIIAAGELVAVALGGSYKDGDEEVHRGRILLYAAQDGTARGEIALDAVPRWDGMAAARGRLYVATENGEVVCLAAPASSHE
jgi:hypothetical protein